MSIMLLILAVGYSTVYRAGPFSIGSYTWGSSVHRCDFSVFTAAARAALAGTDIYQAQNPRGWYYVYPPPFALLMIPFAVVPLFWASLAWYFLSVLMIMAAIKLILEMLDPVKLSPDERLWLALLPAGAVLWLLISALGHGQTTPLVLWLVVLALSEERHGRDVRGGLALAAAVLVKVFPVLLLAYFLLRRRWRIIGATLAGLVLFGLLLPSLAFGARGGLAYWNDWVARVAFPAVSSQSVIESSPLRSTLLDPDHLNNQSLTAVMWRITGSDKGRMAALGILAVMAAVTALLGWRPRRSAELAVLGGFVAWMVLAPPISWSHYFSMLMLPLTLLLFLARHERDRGTRILAICSFVVFVVCCFASPLVWLKSWGLLCWGTVGLWTTMMLVVLRRSRVPGEMPAGLD